MFEEAGSKSFAPNKQEAKARNRPSTNLQRLRWIS
jgi:hypothetical protein